MEKLWQLTHGRFCAGIITIGGRIIQAAPCYQWLIGSTLAAVSAGCRITAVPTKKEVGHVNETGINTG